MDQDQKTKILIVEDEEIICKAYANELRDEGFTTFVAVNGKEGLETALREKPDLILLDILMPIMDGLTMMNTLRQSKDVYGQTVPIILLTNLSSNEKDIMKAVTENEPDYYLIKSDWDLSQVITKIRERLGRSK